MSFGRRTLCALALAWSATPACLPRGDAPAGQQVVADRNATLLGLVPANGDGVLRVLFSRPGTGEYTADLYVLSVDDRDGAPAERLLVNDVVSFVDSCLPAGQSCYSFDSVGRMYLSKGDSLYRVDPRTGDMLDLGVGAGWTTSPSGQRVLVFNRTGGYVLYEADDSTTLIDGLQVPSDQTKPPGVPTFVGEDVFYQTADGDLIRSRPGGARQPVASGIIGFIRTGPLLVLARASSNSNLPTESALDPATLEETALPAGIDFMSFGTTASPDGRWMSAGDPFGSLTGQTEPAGSDVILFDRLTGTTESLDASFGWYAAWRPGHAEIWTSTFAGAILPDGTPSSLLIKRPGQPTVTVPGLRLGAVVEDSDERVMPEPFTDDGAFWFALGSQPEDRASSDRIGDADDPGRPTIALVPDGRSARTYWRLADGRLLVEIYTDLDNVFENYDVQAVDPRTGDTFPLGHRGVVTAVGQTRMLGLFHVIYERGDLTTVDLASGRSTVLAHEFAMQAFAEPQGADSYPAGGRVVYQFQARFESPFDGIWLTKVP